MHKLLLKKVRVCRKDGEVNSLCTEHLHIGHKAWVCTIRGLHWAERGSMQTQFTCVKHKLCSMKHRFAQSMNMVSNSCVCMQVQ